MGLGDGWEGQTATWLGGLGILENGRHFLLGLQLSARVEVVAALM